MSATATVRALPPVDPAQRYTIPEAAAYLRVSRAWIYELIDRRELRSIRDGRRRFIPGAELVRRSA